MDDLIFLEQEHIYMLCGEVIPSVTELCRFLHREVYATAPVWAMEAAAIRGSAVHAAAQALDETGRAEIAEDYLPYVQAYGAFLREHSPFWEMIETPMYHPRDNYAGTLDRYGLVDGKRAIVDIKTTYTLPKKLCQAQLNLYRRTLEVRGYPVEKLYILHLKKDGSYRLMEMARDDALPEALLTLHNATAKKRRRKHGK